MKSGKISVSLNLSSQANMKNAENTELSQYNFAVLLGTQLTEAHGQLNTKTKVSVKIKKTGELEINGLLSKDLKDPGIKVYSETKKTVSENSGSQDNGNSACTMLDPFTGGEIDG